jgi:cardiolipin synthase (CMP-forming)
MPPLTTSTEPRYQLRDLLGVPGLLSLARVPLAVLFFFIAGDRWWALGVIALAGLTDLLDGWWARRFHQTSSIGAVVDGATDKVFVLGVVIALTVTHRMAPWQAALLGAREVGEVILAGVVLLRRDAPARHHEQRADALGKLTTGLQFATVALALWRSPATGCFAVATGALGAIAALHYARRSL